MKKAKVRPSKNRSVSRRNTKQKDIVWKAVEKTTRPLSVPSLLVTLRAMKSSINKTTVYRIIEQLIEEGRLSLFTSPDRVNFYDISSEHSHAHFHFVCEDCGEVTCLEKAVLPSKVDVPKGYKINSVQSTVLGICKRCS